PESPARAAPDTRSVWPCSRRAFCFHGPCGPSGHLSCRTLLEDCWVYYTIFMAVRLCPYDFSLRAGRPFSSYDKKPPHCPWRECGGLMDARRTAQSSDETATVLG